MMTAQSKASRTASQAPDISGHVSIGAFRAGEGSVERVHHRDCYGLASNLAPDFPYEARMIFDQFQFDGHQPERHLFGIFGEVSLAKGLRAGGKVSLPFEQAVHD
jgi:hypothetical protein